MVILRDDRSRHFYHIPFPTGLQLVTVVGSFFGPNVAPTEHFQIRLISGNPPFHSMRLLHKSRGMTFLLDAGLQLIPQVPLFNEGLGILNIG